MPVQRVLQRFLGIEPERVTWLEKLVATVGGFLGIYLIIVVTSRVTDLPGSAIIVPSLGASAVLLFAVPHGRLSQPWALFGGHVVSALIGVTCYRFIGDPFLAAGLAVGLAIGAMHVLDCIHPPGGATALAAVIGGPALHELGYLYVVLPIFVNVLIIFLVAVGFNALFRWRRYPASLSSPTPVTSSHREAGALDLSSITQEDLDYAMRQMNLILDITVEDLVRLYSLASKHSQSRHLSPEQIRLGHYYSNGLFGKLWQVRHVIDESGDTDPKRDQVIYKIVAGPGRRSTGTCSREEFARWARYEVMRNENSWQRSSEETESQGADSPTR